MCCLLHRKSINSALTASHIWGGRKLPFISGQALNHQHGFKWIPIVSFFFFLSKKIKMLKETHCSSPALWRCVSKVRGNTLEHTPADFCSYKHMELTPHSLMPSLFPQLSRCFPSTFFTLSAASRRWVAGSLATWGQERRVLLSESPPAVSLL